ncbi:MAG: GNAT family N-acetyltransferase [Gemmataceae bacterium]|nr:GNAT family N-acetyltransferase [Gemmataceae bacterium]MCI0742878.1 GNAT family N-acetyltransferase [Gemmataceae bacterium]
MANWIVEPLNRNDHERSIFTCGKAALDEFLHKLVSQYEKRRLGRTFVAVEPGQKRVLGYYTLASGAVAYEHLPPKSARKLPKHSVPVILLARLAVDSTAQGQGLGGFLLIDALKRSGELSKSLGVHAVEVEAIDDEAVRFYQRFGFVALKDSPLHLFLPLSVVDSAF